MQPLLQGFADLLRPPVWEWFALLVGMLVGSFANVCIYRIPEGLSVVSPRSRCPRCASEIHALDNIPVLSWIALLGRCRVCRRRISARYPAVEAANGLLYFALAVRLGPTLAAACAMVFATLLLILSLIDFDHHLLPNVLTLPGIVFGLVASLVRQPPSLLESALSALGGYLTLALVARVAEWHYGEEALGQGDWKMVAMLGAFLGAKPTLLAVLIGAFCGAVLGLALVALGSGSRRTRLPFGTFLGLGGLATQLAGPALLHWYGSLFLV